MNSPGNRVSRMSPAIGSAPGRFRQLDVPHGAAGLANDVKPLAPGLLTDAQLAERWQLSRGTLANQRSQGRGPAYMKIAGRVRYRLSDIQAFEQAGFVQTQQAPMHSEGISRQSIELLIRSAGE